MSLIVEAIYESGVLKPLAPLSELNEHERVRLMLERRSTVEDAVLLLEQQRQHRIQIDPRFAREIGDSHEYDLTPSFGSCQGALTILAEDNEHLQDFKESL